MELEQIAKRLPWFLDAGITVEITGPSGIGKSDMVVQVANDLAAKRKHPVGVGRHFVATWGPQDVTGYLTVHMQEIIDADGNKKNVPVSMFSMPPWAVDDNGVPLNSFQQAICVLEEYDKAIVEVKKALAPVTLGKQVAQWKLGDHVGVVILTNDASSSRQGSTKDFDFTINRKVILTASSTVAGWMKWADENNVDPMFKAFAEKFPQLVFSGTVPEKQGPFCTPRSLVGLSELAHYMIDESGHLHDREGFVEIGTGAIGAPACLELVTWLQMRDEVPTFAEMVAKPTSVKVPEDPSGQLMAAHIAASSVDEKTMEPIVKYMRRLQPQFHIVFVKSATRKNFRLVNNKAFEKWTNDEPQLVSLLNVLGGVK